MQALHISEHRLVKRSKGFIRKGSTTLNCVRIALQTLWLHLDRFLRWDMDCWGTCWHQRNTWNRRIPQDSGRRRSLPHPHNDLHSDMAAIDTHQCPPHIESLYGNKEITRPIIIIISKHLNIHRSMQGIKKQCHMTVNILHMHKHICTYLYMPVAYNNVSCLYVQWDIIIG